MDSASMAPVNLTDHSDTTNGEAILTTESSKEESSVSDSVSESETNKIELKLRVETMWEQMNTGLTNKPLKKSFPRKPCSTADKNAKKRSNNWMSYLGLAPKNTKPQRQDESRKGPTVLPDNTCEEAKRLAAAALSAVRDSAALATSRGKVEITEVRDFAGQEIEVKKLVDIGSKEASEKTKASAPSAVDAVLEQIKKKQKLSVLDKTKKDWGEFKDENKGMEEELDAYKKSSNQYLDRVSFLQRTDFREFERERDARLALQARRRPDMSED